MEKQLIISKLPLCKDTHNLIKSYLYYDEIQSYARHCKGLVNFIIHDSFYNNYEYWDSLPPPDLWFFMYHETCMAKKFCSKCGNYACQRPYRHLYPESFQKISCDC